MVVYRDADRGIRTHSARAEDSARAECTHLNAARASAQDHDADSVPRAERSEASLRSEAAYLNAPDSSRRPLGSARSRVAKAFDSILHRHWLAGETAFSNVLVAKSCGVVEKQVRHWRDGERALPVAALLTLPPTIAVELVAWVQDQRALTPHRRGVPMLNDALDQIERRVDRDDRAEVVRALADAQRRIGELLVRIASEGA